MNIIKVSAAPSNCPFCGEKHTRARACIGQCSRASPEDFTNMFQFGSTPVHHVHVSCAECGYTYLSEPYDAAEVKRTW